MPPLKGETRAQRADGWVAYNNNTKEPPPGSARLRGPRHPLPACAASGGGMNLERLRQHLFVELAHRGDGVVGVRRGEIEVERRDAEPAQRAHVLDEIRVAARE